MVTYVRHFTVRPFFDGYVVAARQRKVDRSLRRGDVKWYTVILSDDSDLGKKVDSLFLKGAK